MIQPHILEAESPTHELALMLVGAKKAGKSYLAATAPGNIVFYDFDQRINALRTHPNAKNIFGLTFQDPTDTNTMPTALNEMLDCNAKLERSPFLRDLHPSFAHLGDRVVDTVVFDSIQSIADSARHYVLYNGGGELERKFVIGGRVYRVAKTFHAWGGEMEMVTQAVLQARAILHCRKCWHSATFEKAGPNAVGVLRHTTDPRNREEAAKLDADHKPDPRALNVIVILHECMEEDERSTDSNPIYTGKIEVYPRRYNNLLIYFNEVWRLTRESGRVPKVTCDPDGRFTQAATALGIKEIREPNIASILRDIENSRPRVVAVQPKVG